MHLCVIQYWECQEYPKWGVVGFFHGWLLLKYVGMSVHLDDKKLRKIMVID